MKKAIEKEMAETTISVTLEEFERIVTGWIDEAIWQQHSAATIELKRLITDKFLWWARQEGHTAIGAAEIRRFLAYVGGEAPPGGRWGNPSNLRKNRPRTVKTYAERLRTLFRWAVSQELLADDPMKAFRPITARRDQILPFTEKQFEELLAAAVRSRYPLRDRAVCLFLLDTGARVSEACGLQTEHLDLENCRATVLGKGNKRRTLYFGSDTHEALRQHLENRHRGPEGWVFDGERHPYMTRSGMKQLVERLGNTAGLKDVRCSPHTFRHTAALWSVRNGMHQFALQAMLGHTDLQMTRRYVAMAQTDLESQHRRFNPVRRLTKMKGEVEE